MKLRNYSKVCSCISRARDQDDNTKVMWYPGNTYCRRVKNDICTILKGGLDKESKWLLSFIFKSKFTHTCDGTSHPCLHAMLMPLTADILKLSSDILWSLVFSFC